MSTVSTPYYSRKLMSCIVQSKNNNGFTEWDTSLKIDSGTWNTMEVRPWQHPTVHTEGRIRFSKQFTAVPVVSLSLSSVDVSNAANFRVKVYATNITLEGFTVHAESWADTKLYSCGASWLAIGQ